MSDDQKFDTNAWDFAQTLAFWGAIAFIFWVMCGAPGC